MTSEKARKRMQEYRYTTSPIFYSLSQGQHLSKDEPIRGDPAAQGMAAGMVQVVQLHVRANPSSV